MLTMFGTHKQRNAATNRPSPWKVPINTEAHKGLRVRQSRGGFLVGVLSSFALIATFLVVSGPAATRVAAAGCTTTPFLSRDGFYLTAAQMGGDVTGTLDATGCNIGVYYDNNTAPGNVTGATISHANYFGVLVNGANRAVSVNVKGSTISNIGDNPLNGSQHGNAIFYTTLFSTLTNLTPVLGTGTASGTISGNAVTHYQKNGITINGSVTATITNNVVNGEGPVDYIAQNGIQIGYGARASVTENTVTGNAYTGANQASSAGILVVGGAYYSLPVTTDLTITKNTLTGNDIGVALFNGDTSGNAVATKTNDSVKLNTITNDAVTNTTGNGATCGYQAGISDVGHKDLIVNNTISGLGYTPVSGDCSGSPMAFVRFVDADASARAISSNK